MDETMVSNEEEVKPERAFDNMLDLSPIEHIFFLASSLTSPDGRYLSSKTLKEAFREDERLAKDANLLLRPLGLATGGSNMKDIKKKREEKGRLESYFSCFEPTVKLFEGGYSFVYVLAAPDENGRIPNKFEFKLTRNTPNGWNPEDEEDIDVFRKVKLTEMLSSVDVKERPLFNLLKNEEEGTLTLTYLPVQESIKQQ